MPVLSPAAYDALLLEKVKLLLDAAMRNPRRRGPPSTYEAFVEGLDIRDDSSLRAFEVLLYETTTRRPRKVRRTEVGPSTSTADPVGLRRTRRALSDADLHAGYEFVPTRDMFAESTDSESSESDRDIARPLRRTLQRPVGVRNDDAWALLPALWPPALEPSAAEQQLSDDLFGMADGPSISQVLPNLESSGGHNVLITPDLPTFEELWSILLDDPFPSARITSFPSFLAELNSSSFSTATFVSPDLQTLIYDLTQRDPALPIRIFNTMRNRARGTHRASMRQTSLLDRPTWIRRRREERLDETLAAAAAEETTAAAEVAEEDSRLREGIWRTSFVEHLPGGTSRAVAIGFDAPNEGDNFTEFARLRREERRHTMDELIARRLRGAEEARARATAVGAAETASADTPAPAITVTTASTPAASTAHSPPAAPATACPPSAAPRTSASIAEAHFRAQRPVVPLRALPLPSAGGDTRSAEPAADDASAALRAVAETLQGVRQRRSLAPEEEARGREMR
ncbi:hypothetical protein JCM3770_000187 [Rhodotorula araucariae]